MIKKFILFCTAITIAWELLKGEKKNEDEIILDSLDYTPTIDLGKLKND